MLPLIIFLAFLILTIFLEIFYGGRIYIVAGFAEEIQQPGRGMIKAYYLYARNLQKAVDKAWDMLYNEYPKDKWRNHNINVKVI